MTVLVKKQTVMHRDPLNKNPNRILFTNVEEYTESDLAYVTETVLSRETWEDMGSPKNITVTIQPGDLLNGDES